MIGILEQVKRLYALEGCTFAPVSGHEGGRNQIVTVSRNGEKQYAKEAHPYQRVPLRGQDSRRHTAL